MNTYWTPGDGGVIVAYLCYVSDGFTQTEKRLPYTFDALARRLAYGRDVPEWICFRVAIVGSREWKDARRVFDYVYSLPENTEIVSGGARGVDSYAEYAAKERGLACKVFYADWNTHGKSAGMRRNAEIVEYADIVTAFWDGVSRGTANTIKRARKAGKPVEVIAA